MAMMKKKKMVKENYAVDEKEINKRIKNRDKTPDTKIESSI